MNRRFIRNLRFSLLQLLLNQGLAFVLFIFLSNQLSKEAFGSLNWSLALLLIIFSLLSFGMDQLLVKKIAAGEDASRLVGAYLFHCLITGLFFYFLLLMIWMLGFQGSFRLLPLLLLAFGKFFLSLSAPFKSVAGGREKFGLLFLMSMSASLVKVAGVAALFFTGRLDLGNTVLVFLLGDVMEFVAALAFMQRQLPVRHVFRFDKKLYLELLRESLPQFGVALFAIGLARADHVILGILLNESAVAEYSVAYKVFELASFPLLVIGPVLLPMVSRNFSNQVLQQERLLQLLRLEILLACLTIVVLNLLWTPVADYFTAGKYGAVNASTILILSFSVPLLYFNNVLWTLLFAQGALRTILLIFVSGFAMNLLLLLLLVPLFGNEAAAAAYSVAILFQTGFYLKKTSMKGSAEMVQTLALCFSLSVAVIYLAKYLIPNVAVAAVAGSLAFALLLVFVKQLKKADWVMVKEVVRLG